MNYITATELIEFLSKVPGETHIKIQGDTGKTIFATDFFYHELTGVHIS